MPNTSIPATGEAMPMVETPHEEIRRLSWRIADLLNGLDPRIEYVTIRASSLGSGAVTTGFDIPMGDQGQPAADPLLEAITAYRKGCDALNDLHIAEGTSLGDEGALIDAVYGKQKAVLIEAAPTATSIDGVREAIRLAFDEEAIDDMVAEGALRAALAYLDEEAA